MKKILFILYVLPLFLQGQHVRFKSFNLKNFPQINFSITIEDDSGRIYPVKIDSVKLFENTRKVDYFHFYPLDSIKAPIYTVIVIDRSGSMAGVPIQEAKKAAKIFINLMRPQDKTAYIIFGNKVHVISSFTNDRLYLNKVISKTMVQGNTALYDAIYAALGLFKNIELNAIKVVIALTDGADNRSRHKIPEIIRLANDLDVKIYTIGLGNKIKQRRLKEIAYSTDGSYYFALHPRELKGLYRNISILLHSSILFSYKTNLPLDNEWYPIDVVIYSNKKIIKGERKCLFAKYSKIPHHLLEEIDAYNGGGGSEINYYYNMHHKQKYRFWKYLKVLIYTAIVLTVVLIMILIVRLI